MNYHLDILTPPADEPVTLEEAKLHARILCDAEDLLLESWISAARGFVEEYLSRSLCRQTLQLSIDRFPCSTPGNPFGSIFLPRPPLIEVNEIRYLSPGGWQVLEPDQYRIQRSKITEGRIDLNPDTTWPASSRAANTVEVVYQAGYGTPGDVPANLKSAILLIVGHLYENREQVTDLQLNELPFGVKTLLSGTRWTL